ncbi:helix-turn-helix domain-containing protein [Micromonospora sp. NEAU-HG-1]|nr:helix-turn-helix domain-containing protein [Micromonospora rubida]
MNVVLTLHSLHSKQQFADRLGKSESWVDKVERGVRRLERVSNLREIADALRIDLEILLAERPGQPDPAAAGLEGVQAALAAAGRGNESVARELLDRAEGVADEGFGRAAVEAARVVAEAALGDVTAATVRHERLTAGDEWRWLPPEHRAAYLVDAARAYARAGGRHAPGGPGAAGRGAHRPRRGARPAIGTGPGRRRGPLRRRPARPGPARRHPPRHLTSASPGHGLFLKSAAGLWVATRIMRITYQGGPR